MKRWKPVMYFSKSKYTSFRQCPKIVRLDKYKPEEKEIDESAQERSERQPALYIFLLPGGFLFRAFLPLIDFLNK